MMECGKSFGKNAVFYLNVVYGLFGLIIEGIGFGLLVKWITTTAEHDTIGLSWLFYIMAGVLMATTALFGCYGAARERKGMLIAYAIFMLTVFVLQVALAVVLSVYSCFIEAVFEHIAESMFRGGNSTNVYHKAEPKKCDEPPLEVLTGVIAFYLCSVFNDAPCAAKQDGSFERWYIPTNIVTIGVPIIEVISGCVALYLAIYLATTERRSYNAVLETTDNIIPAAKQPLVC